ncbi:MAG: hypothetical protein ABR66_01150 [Microbacteriaceae bacterium BACL25 MAG-120322-bin65]|jgi:cysteine desulfurase|nr:MAG: hypothetical protein ABR66_01150 [Microbacteriaceae bacterium BACL25 MAG-120322-bin65]
MGIYLDNQATTPMSDEVKAVYLEALGTIGNPSAVHQAGQRARAQVEDARARVATALGCDTVEVIFTSGGTEAINQALKGAVWAKKRSEGRDAITRVVTTGAEHNATLDALGWLAEQEGTDIVYAALTSEAVIDLVHLESILESQEVTMVSSLLANNEVGSIQPVEALCALAREHRTPVHIDAVAACGYLPIDFSALGASAMSVSAHKVGGPVGVGALLLSRTAPEIQALHHGGEQQRGRSGTIDMAGAVAFAAALEIQERNRLTQVDHLRQMRDYLLEGLTTACPQVIVRGSLDERLPGNAHLTVPGCEGDVLLYLFDQHEIHVSTGSACQAGVPEASHVLIAMGVGASEARGALRFSMGYSVTKSDLDAVIRAFPSVVEKASSAGLAAG